MNAIAIEYQNTADLIPYARNSRTHSDEQVAQIAASIREFGFTNPVLIDAENGIIAGHGRILGAAIFARSALSCCPALWRDLQKMAGNMVTRKTKRWQPGSHL